MNNIEFLEAIEQIKNNLDNENFAREFCSTYEIENMSTYNILKQCAMSGKKHIDAVARAVEQEGDIEIDKIVQFSKFTEKFLQKNGFISPLLITSYPEDKIDDFNKEKWGSVTKVALRNKTEIKEKTVALKIALKLALNFGIFENDDKREERLGSLTNFLSKGTEKYAGFMELDDTYEPEKYKFLEENIERIEEINLDELQKKWGEISKYVDDKSFSNIQKYLKISQRNNNDEFKTYMEMHESKVSEYYMSKYNKIFEYMQSRTRTSMPDVKGKSEEEYEYEMLNFTDIRVIRFGNKENTNCCQQLGGNAETSMLNSAIEGSSRAIIVKDDKGEEIAGSFVTHKIGKDGKSYVCFDSIELKASKLGVSVRKFQFLKQKINKLYNKGKIKSLDVKDIREYVESTKGKASIGNDELKSLEVCEKVKNAYKTAISDMIIKDEKIRDEQLKNGEITKEEYDRLLIKNGLVTVGNRNFSKIYLNDLESIDKSHKELLPTPEKKMSVYKKMHALSLENVLEKVAMGVLNTGIVVGAIGVIASLAVATTIVPGAIIAGTFLGLKEGFKFKYKNKHKGIYTDAKRDQKILYSGIKEYQDTISKEEQKDLNKKLVYIRDKLIMPVKVVDLTDEQKKDISRIQEVTNKDSFNEKDSQKMVMGSKNWYMLFTECKSGITIEDVVMPGNSCLKKNNGKDSQEALLASLKQLVLAAKKNGREVNFNIANEKTNKFCERYSKDVLDKFDRSVEEKISKDRRNAIEKNKENEGIEISR